MQINTKFKPGNKAKIYDGREVQIVAVESKSKLNSEGVVVTAIECVAGFPFGGFGTWPESELTPIGPPAADAAPLSKPTHRRLDDGKRCQLLNTASLDPANVAEFRFVDSGFVHRLSWRDFTRAFDSLETPTVKSAEPDALDVRARELIEELNEAHDDYIAIADNGEFHFTSGQIASRCWMPVDSDEALAAVRAHLAAQEKGEADVSLG